ncbi:MAG: glycosyltransferase family 2 protein [Deltaproteobacteria bacterium]|nr:MAG: glycosyltransferase family 2 protein [Deltaproteobacteria bacterium]
MDRTIDPGRRSICAVIPIYDNLKTIRRVVEHVRRHLVDVIVVDDGSGEATAEEVKRLAEEGLVTAVHRRRNGGKGAAVKDGLAKAHALGFTHVFQVDADGQHDLGRLPEFLRASERDQGALVLGYPEFVGEVPPSRLRGRAFTNLWVAWEVGSGVIRDAMIGYRVYPIERALATCPRSDRMEFDIEIVVRMAWTGMPVINIPVEVRYLNKAEGGFSSFRLFEDNVRISWMHARLATSALFRRIAGRVPARSD